MSRKLIYDLPFTVAILFSVSVASAADVAKAQGNATGHVAFQEADETPIVDLPDLNMDAGEARTLTLEESVKLAIRVASSVQKAANASEISGAQLLQSYGQFLPNLTTQANSTFNQGTEYYAQSTPITVNNMNNVAAYSLTLDLNIFNGISDYSHLRSSLLRKDAADLTVHRAKQAIALDITQSFLNVILDNHLVGIAKKNLQQSRAREKLLLEQTRVGAKSLADLFRQQAQMSSDESLLLNAENKKRSDQILLLQKLRLDVTKNYVFEDVALEQEQVNRRFDDEKKLLQVGLAKRADLRGTEKVAHAADWDIDSQWGNYLPKLDLVAGASSGGTYLFTQNVAGQNMVPASQTPLYNQLGSQVEYSVGLVLTWTIFDRLVNHQQVETARANARNAEIDNEDLRNQVQADVRIAFSSYKTAVQQVHSSGKGLAAAQKAYEVIEGRYEVGSANFIDLVTSQTALLQAESARVQALTDFVLQGRSVEFATGEIAVE